MKLKPLVAIAAVAGLAILPATASAVTPTNVWVAPLPTTISAADSSCSLPGYNTIQSAINAVPAGATIHVCAGTYVEQLQITKSVSLVGSGSVTVKLPATPVDSTTACDTAPGTGSYQPDQDGIAICGVATVSITGLTIDPAWASDTCYDSLYGILVGGGATLDMTNTSVIAGGAVPINGCQGGVAVQVGMSWTAPEEIGHAVLTNDTVSGYQKNGITIDGIGSSASISRTTVTGAGPTPETAQNGIQISDGAFATITGSTITGDECDVASCGSDPDTDYQATGILFDGAAAGSSVTQSNISDNDIGVYNYDASATAPRTPEVAINNDVLTKDRWEGIALDQGWATIDEDVINGGLVGIDVFQYDGQSYAADGTAWFDTIANETVAAVHIDSDRAGLAGGDVPGVFTIDFSDLRGNAARVVNTSLDYRVIALLDF